MVKLRLYFNRSPTKMIGLVTDRHRRLSMNVQPPPTEGDAFTDRKPAKNI